ncbi:ABC transporter ATP-binding protein [Alsobacter sp. SYSU M60028]|uniref:ABC transporter ATP-binding protein n=1 Tax=Alsobacter ponti TaxID=2962936 RepID=A0ABT1LBN9_9HYPH|nr:ABC transporter ATP-binding protein [Alsobacter ponti]MCP8938473.1 ABC transporter ATP-binding protein [Alsobacter ponti]
MTPLLDVRDLSIVLPREDRDLVALNNASFTLGRGEVLGLVGESGAGKSLTGAAIIDLLSPPLRRSAGRITLDGERIDGLTPAQMEKVRGRRIGFVFQDPLTSLNPVLTIGRHFTDTLLSHFDISFAEARRRAVHWIGRVGLSDPELRFDQYPHHLSGGMRQRIVIALALCCEPLMVIADEPTTALDVSVQAHVLKLLRDLHAETGVAVLLITHDLGVMAKMADRVAVLYAGRIVEIGPAARLLGAPHHPYTRGLLRATPSHKAAAGRLEPIPGSMPNLASIPSGCAFHPRCPRATEICRDRVPVLEGRHEGDAVACWHPVTEDRP